MALHQGGECFAKWTHVEDGQEFTRRLHRIVLQTPNGRVKTITGDKLPDSIHTFTSHPYVGVDFCRTLILPETLPNRFKRRALLRLWCVGGWWVPREVRNHFAALHQLDACATRLDHVESGPPLHRQVRRIQVQTRGHNYVFYGKTLPVFIGICTGTGFKGKHTAQILLSSESSPNGLETELSWATTVDAWPELRDVLHVALGVVGFLVLRFLLNVITSLS